MGGFFDGGASPKTPKPNRKANTSGVNEQAPGGFFQGGADPKAPNNAASSATDSKFWAEQSKGWAVGIDEEGLTDWSRTNNSKAYAEDAAASATAAAEDAAQAAADSDSAKLNAQAAARDKTLAEEAATRAKSWAVGPSGANIDGTDTDNAKYWAEQAESHGGNGREWARDAQGWAVGDTDDPLGGWTDSDNAKSYAEAAETARVQAANSATAAASSASDAEGYRNDALIAKDAAQDAEQEAQDALESTVAAMEAADSDRQLAEAAANSADSDAIVARGWAIDTDSTGSFPYSANSAKYWALRAEAVSSFDSVQYDFEVGEASYPDGVSYDVNARRISLTDSDLYVEEPIVTYNGIVLSDSEHYTVSPSGNTITFQTIVGVSNGDNITVTGGTERNKLDTDFFIAGDGITIADSDSKVKISASTDGVDYDALKDIITAGENVTIDTDDTDETLTINSTASGGGGGSYAMAETIGIAYTGATWSGGAGGLDFDEIPSSNNTWINWTGGSFALPSNITGKDSDAEAGGFSLNSLLFTNNTGSSVEIKRADLILDVYTIPSGGSTVSSRYYSSNGNMRSSGNFDIAIEQMGIIHVVIDSDILTQNTTIADGEKFSIALTNANHHLKVLQAGYSFSNDEFVWEGSGGTRTVTATGFTKMGDTPIAFTHNYPWLGIATTSDPDTDDYTWIPR